MVDYIIATILTLTVLFLYSLYKKKAQRERRRDKVIENIQFKTIKG